MRLLKRVPARPLPVYPPSAGSNVFSTVVPINTMRKATRSGVITKTLMSLADDVNGVDSLAGMLGGVRPVQKTLLLDLRTLGLPLDNVEGMTIGPTLPDGRRSLVLVSDNNFAPSQFTQFLLFALD